MKKPRQQTWTVEVKRLDNRDDVILIEYWDGHENMREFIDLKDLHTRVCDLLGVKKLCRVENVTGVTVEIGGTR